MAMKKIEQMLVDMEELLAIARDPNTEVTDMLRFEIQMQTRENDELRLERNSLVRRCHFMEERISELHDKVETMEKRCLVLEKEKHEVSEKLKRQKLKRKMEQWMCDTVEEYEELTDRVKERQEAKDAQIETLRKKYRRPSPDY